MKLSVISFLPPFCVYARHVAAIAARFGQVAKSSEKALVKLFCEKNFTEFLARVEKMVSVFFIFPVLGKVQKQGSSTVCDRNRQKNIKSRKTGLKKRLDWYFG